MVKKVAKISNKETKAEVWISKEVYGEAPEKYHFVLKDGKKIKNLKELAESLSTMGDDVFHHHVNSFRNDFSSWVNDVFNEKTLAEELKHMNNKLGTELILYKNFEKKLNKIIKKLSK